MVIYEFESNSVNILAVIHSKRNPQNFPAI